MTMIVWRTIDDNPCLGSAKQVVLKHLPQPGDDARTCGPGPFSMANQEMVTAQLKAAGYEDITFERVDAPIRMGDTVGRAISPRRSMKRSSPTSRPCSPPSSPTMAW